MPLYEYQCGACGHRFEKIQKFSDPPVEVCPECGGAVRKLQSAPAFQLKGTGWYVTDYARKDGGGKDTKAEKADKGEPADKSGKKESEGKTEPSEKSDKSEKTTAPASDAGSASTSTKPAASSTEPKS